MSLLRALLASKPVRTPLDFGVNDNVRLVKIDNAERTRDGEKISRNTYMTFAKYDSKGKKIASSEFSYFNLDSTSDLVKDNLIQQVAQLNDIVSFFGVEGSVDPTSNYTSMQDLIDDLRSKKGCKSLMDTMWEQFSDLIGDLVGESSPLARIKVVTDSKGKWLQLPRDSHIIESMDQECTLSVSSYELKMRDRGLEAAQETPDEKGDAPGEKPKKKSALSGL